LSIANLDVDNKLRSSSLKSPSSKANPTPDTEEITDSLAEINSIAVLPTPTVPIATPLAKLVIAYPHLFDFYHSLDDRPNSLSPRTDYLVYPRALIAFERYLLRIV
jgi:hypothetical protein